MIDLIETALSELSAQHTERELGDRSSYVGASDIGGCQRKAVLSKIDPRPHTLSELLRFRRGHIAEDIIAESLKHCGRFRFERQHEVEDNDPVPVKAHLDFVFHGRYSLGVLEVKAPRTMPSSVYDSWEMQLYFQMGLLQKATGVPVKGGILAVDLFEGTLRLHNGYRPNDEIFQGLWQRAQQIWDAVNGRATPEIETGPLCGYCNYIEDCPAFKADEIPELSSEALRLGELKEQKKFLDKEIKQRSQHILKIVQETGPFRAGGIYFTSRQRSYTVTDFASLGEALSSAGMLLDDFQTTRKSSPYLEMKSLGKAA